MKNQHKIGNHWFLSLFLSSLDKQQNIGGNNSSWFVIVKKSKSNFISLFLETFLSFNIIENK